MLRDRNEAIPAEDIKKAAREIKVYYTLPMTKGKIQLCCFRWKFN